MQQTVVLAKTLAERVGRELHIPVYCYEEAASSKERRNLAWLRKGDYEALPLRMQEADFIPDYGPEVFNAQTGATVIGARNFLIAWNINLNTSDTQIARQMAAALRESGGQWKVENGATVHRPGRFRSLKAIGWYMEAFGCAQVSTNITNFRLSPMHQIYEAARTMATEYNAEVKGSELIGLLPLEAILTAGQYYAESFGLSNPDEAMLIEAAVKGLGLSALRPFSPKENIIEYKIAASLMNP
jgi:glutamate formiminotransferase/formiminotetrahydrofolate cyclodeaminase